MPKYRSEIAKAKAKALIKLYIRNGLNQRALAKERGVSPQAIGEQLKRPIVQQTLAEYLQKSFKYKYIKTKFNDGLEANKVVGYLNNKVEGAQKVSDEFVEVPDLHCRHKYLVTLLECQKYLKHNTNGNGVSISNIVINFKSPQGFISDKEKVLNVDSR